jgi:hypothetical protein
MARKPKTRQTNITYLILVEGETEEIYFQGLKEYYQVATVNIKMRRAKHPQPSQIIAEAIKAQKLGEYRFIWCVYDCDVFLQQDTQEFERIHKIAKDRGVQFAESMLSIEAWFLLHFIKPMQAYQSGESLIQDLQNYIPSYCKEQRWLERNLYKTLQPNEHNALRNVANFSNINYKQAHTATNVDKLVEIFVKREYV